MSASTPALIPRRVQLGNPRRSQPALSPDGMRIAYLAPNEGDALQVWVSTIGMNDDRCVSNERGSIQSCEWAWDSKTIDFLARVEKFLAEHLGGRCEPMEGERVEGSSAMVRVIGPRK